MPPLSQGQNSKITSNRVIAPEDEKKEEPKVHEGENDALSNVQADQEPETKQEGKPEPSVQTDQ